LIKKQNLEIIIIYGIFRQQRSYGKRDTY